MATSITELPTRLRVLSTPREAEEAASDLEDELRRELRGELRFDEGTRALYATDLSIYRQVPIGVVIPRDTDDVEATVAACRRRGVPILGRGTGTSLAGQTCNVAVVIDFSKYQNNILSIDPDARTAEVEPGVICDQLRAAAERHHLTFGPDPATHAYCSLGGMIGNNSCGPHSVMAGKTVENVEELDVLTYDGLRMRVGRTPDDELSRILREGGPRAQIYRKLRELRDRYAPLVRERFPRIPRRVSGYNLDELLPERGFHVARSLVGSESTCALVLRATLRLVPSPPRRALVVIGYPDVFVAADDVPRILALDPIALEGFQAHVLENMVRKDRAPKGAKLLPEGRAWLLAEFCGWAQAEADDRARRAAASLADGASLAIRILSDASEQHAVWHIRESGVGASRVPGVEDAWPSWEDAAVHPDKLGAYLRDLDRLIRQYGYAYTLFGHFGDGCLHTRIAFDLKTAEGVRRYRSFISDAVDLVVGYGGSLSGEHGDGQARGEFLYRMFGLELTQAFRELKAIWDPLRRMNPGKKIDANRTDENIRVGPDHHARHVDTYFAFPEDKGSFALATERCFGVGKCRSLEGGTMCPSFQVLREEKHTTRGRAHLLFEMLRGETITDGFRSEAVKESLDLCLACKGCKGDCPVSVDMASYKAEFLAHHYEGRRRPMAAYAMGLVFRWARLAARVPRLANLLARVPIFGSIGKALFGISTARRIPAFAKETFKRWFARRPRPLTTGPAVLLWPDTFNDHFHPETAKAAVRVLEAAGYRVEVPMEPLCCGRPLYDYGMLDRAKAELAKILDALRPAIQAGVPLVALEPSCLVVFRDELMGLFPDDLDARRLHGQSFTLAEFLVREARAGRYVPPALARRAIVHGHCHQKAVVGMDADEELYGRMGLEAEILDAGCCGMAGSFGFERDKYALSIQIGERALLPAVRGADAHAIVMADGFSCREQIAQTTRRRALHLAEVLDMARREGSEGPARRYPERGYVKRARPSRAARVIAAGASVIGAVAAALWMRRKLA
jgi:FAD/FMN-containing dehydrogenase/Fe-S oxidoreductase